MQSIGCENLVNVVLSNSQQQNVNGHYEQQQLWTQGFSVQSIYCIEQSISCFVALWHFVVSEISFH